VSVTLISCRGVLAPIDRDPNSVLRYGLDLSQWLARGDSVLTVQITAQVGVTADQPTVSGPVVLCRVSGGTVGQPASVTLRWTTMQGDIDERTLHFRVVER
jgi:hypothetical protein